MKKLEYNSKTLEEAVEVLKSGGVVGHPADTCFGFAADLMNPHAVEKIQAIKGRDGDKPMSIMFPISMIPRIHEYGHCEKDIGHVCGKLFPGPITVVVRKGPMIPDYYFPELDTVGIRVPHDELTQSILEAFGGPLITTSANPSGISAFSGSTEVIDAFMGNSVQPDLIFEGRIGRECHPSTVMQFKDGAIDILREGPVSKSELEEIFGLK